jgi:TPR repeat protein
MSSNSEQTFVQELFANLQSKPHSQNFYFAIFPCLYNINIQERIADAIDRIAPELVEKTRDGDGKSLFDIGVKYYNKKMYTKAMAWFQLSVEQNYADAQVKIGIMY